MKRYKNQNKRQMLLLFCLLSLNLKNFSYQEIQKQVNEEIFSLHVAQIKVSCK